MNRSVEIDIKIRGMGGLIAKDKKVILKALQEIGYSNFRIVDNHPVSEEVLSDNSQEDKSYFKDARVNVTMEHLPWGG